MRKDWCIEFAQIALIDKWPGNTDLVHATTTVQIPIGTVPMLWLKLTNQNLRLHFLYLMMRRPPSHPCRNFARAATMLRWKLRPIMPWVIWLLRNLVGQHCKLSLLVLWENWLTCICQGWYWIAKDGYYGHRYRLDHVFCNASKTWTCNMVVSLW